MSIFDTYNKQLKLSNQLDFSDLINFVDILFKKNEEVRRK
jgi:superfamily I DNA/RNA helicase